MRDPTGPGLEIQATYVFPPSRGVWHYLAQLVAFRELLFVMVARDLKARYTHSLLGFYWAIINPLAHAAVYTVAFSLIVRVDVGSTPYPLFVLSGLLCWNLLGHSVIDATESLVEHGILLSRVPFPRVIIPLSAILARIPDFMLSLVVLIVIMAVFGWPFHPQIVVSLLLVGLQVVFVTGIGLCGAALNLFYRDVRHLVNVVLPLWMFMSPLVYPSTLVPERFQGLYQLNPMAGLINAYRTVLLEGMLPTWADVAPAAITGLVLLVGGFWLFKKLEPRFAEVV